jgi:hypothetical protein
MPEPRNVTDWIIFEGAILAADSPKTFDWRGAEDVQALSQFWIDYMGTSTVNVAVHLSPCDRKNKRTMDPALHYESKTVENGASGTGHFVDAPEEMKAGIGQYRVVVTTSANIVASIGVCRNGLG